MTGRRPVGSRHLAWFALAPAILVAGCDRSEFPLVPVSGTVTFDGELPPKAGNVTLQPLEIPPGLPKRPATGKFDVRGAYAVNTFTHHEGVLPGRYRLEITCYIGGPDPSQPDPWAAVNYVAQDYRPTELNIEAGSGPVRHDVDVPRNKTMKVQQ